MEMAQAKSLQKQTIDLAQLTLVAFSRLPHRPETRIRMLLDADPFMLVAEPRQFQQVLGNLLGNAIQAMPDGGEIRVRAWHEEKADIIVMEDDGPGIPAELRERIFEPLVTTKCDGTGLGLAICRQIIEHHQGTIDLLSSQQAHTSAYVCHRRFATPKRTIPKYPNG